MNMQYTYEKSKWWTEGSSVPRSDVHLRSMLEDIWATINDTLGRSAGADRDEIASLALQRIMDEYESGKTYAVAEFIAVIRMITRYTRLGYQGNIAGSAMVPLDSTGTDDDSPSLGEMLADPAVRVADKVEIRVTSAQILASDAITDLERRILKMRYVLDMSPKEIAVKLHMEPNAVHQRTFQATRKLRTAHAQGASQKAAA